VSFTFDLVPAFETANPNWLVIADRDKQQWTKRSDVRALRNKVMTRNLLCQGRWVHQIRMDKHALRQDPTVNELVCGLLVESLVYDAVREALNPQEALRATFAQGARVLAEPYMGLAQDDLTVKWGQDERHMVVAFFQRNLQRAEEALKYEATGDPAAASALWQEVFAQKLCSVLWTSLGK